MSEWRSSLDSMVSRARAADHPGDWNVTVERSRRVTRSAVLVDGVGLSLDELQDARLDDLPGDLVEALRRIDADFDLSTLASYPPAALHGLGNAAKGALFELQVADAVEAGNLELPEGAAELRLVGDFRTPGFDAELLDEHGAVIDLVQLKASSDDAILLEHLRVHEDIDTIITTSEAATAAGGLDGVIDSGISDAVISEAIAGGLTDAATTTGGEVLDELLPQLTYAILAAEAGWKLMRGVPVAEVVADLRTRATSATVVSVIAGLASLATGTDAVRVPVVLSVSALRGLHSSVDASRQRVVALGDVAEGLQSFSTARLARATLGDRPIPNQGP